MFRKNCIENTTVPKVADAKKHCRFPFSFKFFIWHFEWKKPHWILFVVLKKNLCPSSFFFLLVWWFKSHTHTRVRWMEMLTTKTRIRFLRDEAKNAHVRYEREGECVCEKKARIIAVARKTTTRYLQLLTSICKEPARKNGQLNVGNVP